jgi:hypothetical protein
MSVLTKVTHVLLFTATVAAVSSCKNGGLFAKKKDKSGPLDGITMIRTRVVSVLLNQKTLKPVPAWCSFRADHL